MTERLLRLQDRRVSWREVEEEIVGVALDRGEYFSVTPAGALLWAQLNEGTTQPQMVDRLVQHFAVRRAVAEQDVAAFVAALDEWHLLMVTRPETP